MIDREHRITPLRAPEDIERVWQIMKSVRNPRYTKTAFLENLKEEGFNAVIKDDSGRIEAAWLSRGANIGGVDGAFIELAYHSGKLSSLRGLRALARCFFAAVEDGIPVWYYTRAYVWRGSKPAKDGYFEFDRGRFVWVA